MAVLRGFVYLSSGSAVSGASVDYYAAIEGTPSTSLGSTTTNANGYWEFTGLAGAIYDVRVRWDSNAQVRWMKGLTSVELQEVNVEDLRINNPANTFHYTIVASAITADRTITLPLMTGNGTLVVSNMPDNYDWIPAESWQDTSSAIAGTDGNYAVRIFSDGADDSATVTGYFKRAPTAVIVVGFTPGTGNLAYYATTEFAASGEAHTTNSDAAGTGASPLTVAATADQILEIDIIAAFTGAAAGDYFGLTFNRDGADAGDTTSQPYNLFGLLIRY